MADATADSTIFENEGSWVFFDEQLFTKALKPHIRQAIAVANEGSVLFPTDNELDVGLTDAELTEDLVFIETISVPINLDGVLSEGEVFKSLDVSINFDSEDTEVNEGGSLIGDDSVDFFLDNVITEGPWEAPWMPQDRSLSSLDGALDVYPADPYFYLNFDEPHAVPQRIKDNWQRGTEATYWDGSQLRTAAPNEPRVQVDPETGERYLLAEPQQVNQLAGEASTYNTDTWSSANNPEYGTLYTKVGADFMPMSSGPNGAARSISYAPLSLTAGSTYWVRFFVDKSESTPNERHRIQIYDGTKSQDFMFYSHESALSNNSNAYRLSENVWLIKYYFTSEGTGSYINVIPSTDSVSGVWLSMGSFQLEEGQRPTSYIPATSFNTTRAPDDLSDLPFSMEGGAKSVYFRISQEANGYAPNEGGNLTNSEVNLTDTPGTAGGGLLRPSTGILGIGADGWIDAVVNSTDEDLQGNSTSDVVDGLTIQPDKSPSTDGAIYRIHELVAWEEERSYSERRNLTSQRPQPWQELDAPNINTLDTLGGDIDWSTLGIDEPPHFSIDIPRFGIPAKMRSAWQRDTVATYWDENGVLQTAEAGEPRLARSYGGSSWVTEGVLAEPQRTNLIDARVVGNGSWATSAGTTSQSTGQPGIDGQSQAVEIGDTDNSGLSRFEYPHSISTDNGNGWTFSIYVKKDADATVYPAIKIRAEGGTNINARVILNTSNGTLIDDEPNGEFEVEDVGDFWRVLVTINNNGSGNTTIKPQIWPAFYEGGSVDGSLTNSIIVDAPQLERHHAVATDANGYADATHATMPILAGGATRSEDRLVMPVWWPQGNWGGYFEGGAFAGGAFDPFDAGGRYSNSFINLHDGSIDKKEGLTAYDRGFGGVLSTDGTGYRGGGENDQVIAANNDDADNTVDLSKLTILPDRYTSNVSGATFIFSRVFVWPFHLTEGSSGQLKALFDHDFSV